MRSKDYVTLPPNNVSKLLFGAKDIKAWLFNQLKEEINENVIAGVFNTELIYRFNTACFVSLISMSLADASIRSQGKFSVFNTLWFGK